MKTLSLILFSTILVGMAAAHEVGDQNWDPYAAFDGAEVVAVGLPQLDGVYRPLVDAKGVMAGSIREVQILDRIKSPPGIGFGEILLVYQADAPRGKMAMVIPGPQIFFLKRVEGEKAHELTKEIDADRALYEFVEPVDQWKSWLPLPSQENSNVGRLGAIISGVANIDRSSQADLVAYLKFLQKLTSASATNLDITGLDPLAKDLLKLVRESAENTTSDR